MTTELTPFATALTKALETDAHRPRRERRTARAFHAQLKAQGYAGGYTRLTDFTANTTPAVGSKAVAYMGHTSSRCTDAA